MNAALVPWSSPVDGSPGWKVVVPTGQLAASVAAATGGDPQPRGDGGWPVIVRRAGLGVTALGADADTLRVALPAVPGLVLAVRRRRWGDLETLTCADALLPSHGVLTVRRFIVETALGRVLQALVPVFAAAERGGGEHDAG